MTQLAIVADDLTGALDAAAPFAGRGIRTVVALDVAGLDAALASGAEVVGVSTDSREIPAEAARQAVAACMAKLPAGLAVFKKIDSRLKGNIADELDAIAFERALVAPAIPAFGRFVRGGHLLGFGVAEPIDIAARFGRHGAACMIPDVGSQADIEQALAGTEHDLLIGARGLAEALALRMRPVAERFESGIIAAQAYCVIGSTDPITLTQMERLRRANRELCYIAAPDGCLPVGSTGDAALTVVQAVPGDGADPAEVAKRLGAALVALAPPAGATLVISGGATAQVVLRALDIGLLELLGEALPGLPIAQAGGLTIITKSGGFGDSDALVRLLGQIGVAQ